MKKINIKKCILFSYLLCFMLILIGCDIIEPETVSVDKTLPRLNTLNGNTLQLVHDIEGFKFKSNYNTGKYTLNNWRITDSKNIKMQTWITDVPNGTEVLIEHVHIDISLKSCSPQLDGFKQDSMDDSYHGYSQDGFLISNKYPYENTFAIDGFSKDIIDGWNFYCGDYGNGHLSSERLTEKNLIKNGTYANKLTVVYDLLIKNKGEQKYHTKSIVDEILIPAQIEENSTTNLNNKTSSNELKENNSKEK
ncbi:hypothetical protein [Clostridium botulinum]|uniref:hypothetical protein n=1 Tax=Clostridium botulinum TaxID=1491 RepID=UPI003DA41471